MLWDFCKSPAAQPPFTHHSGGASPASLQPAVAFAILDIPMEFVAVSAIDALVRETALVAFFVPAMPTPFLFRGDGFYKQDLFGSFRNRF